jgi:sterol desaturase/sphingolipid hydroxylase (fatty acid hydroxylase superfamily)
MRSGYWKFIKRYHMAHHFKNPDAIYGVSSPVWDYVLHTATA